MTTAPATTRTPRLTFGGVLRSEWIKLRSLRSTFWCYVILIVLTVGLSALVAVALPTDGSIGPGGGDPNAPVDPTAEPTPAGATWLTISTIGVGFAQLVIMVLGALVITGEYGTGMIRSTFAAVPRRLPAIAAKALVFGAVTFVVSGVALVASTLLSLVILQGRDVDLDAGEPAVWWGILGAIGYLTLLGVLSLAIGTILRSSAAAIATSLGLVLVVPTIFSILGAVLQTTWPSNVTALLPSGAGGQMYAYEPVAAFENDILTLDAGLGLLVLAAWVVVAGAVAALLVTRRDA